MFGLLRTIAVNAGFILKLTGSLVVNRDILVDSFTQSYRDGKGEKKAWATIAP